jgi:hypothetical protein
MSAKKLAEKVLADIKKAGDRTALVQQDGQILFVSPDRFKETLTDIFSEDLDDKSLNKIWAEWDKYLKTQVANVTSKARLRELQTAMGTLKPKGDEVGYIIAKYETIKRAKGGNGKLGSIIKDSSFIKKGDNRLDLVGGEGKFFGSQLGHEEDSRGAAASTSKVLKAQNFLSRTSSKGDQTRVRELIDTYINTLEVKITHEQMYTKNGGLKKKYIPILTWQKAIDNQTQLDAERAALKSLEDGIADEIKNNLKGSTPLVDLVGQVLLSNVAPKSKKAKTKGKKKAVFNEKNTKTAKEKTKKKSKIKVARDNGLPSSLGALVRKKKGARAVSPFSYMAMINKKLPQTVRKNMSPPGFQNQSGRFANSVKIQDVNITKQGHPSFGYTYAKNPYQVFEVGEGAAPWATPQRDPRKLIDKSIRQVAAELAIGRFYTRRL